MLAGRMTRSGIASRALALAGVAALALQAGSALAQDAGALSFDAGEAVISSLDQDAVIQASGGVRLEQDGRVLTAQSATLDRGAGVYSAQGDVVITTPDQGVAFADEVIADEDLNVGLAKRFSARLPGNVQVAADTVVRRSATVDELNRAIYTPCPTCEADGVTPMEPSWSVQAEKVVFDRERHLIYFRNAYVRLKGVPIGPVPVFFLPDADAPRTSGFLPPRIGVSDRRGLSYEQPYYLAISPYSEATITPQVNTNLRPFLMAEYQRRFWSGDLRVRGGYTYERDVQPNGLKFGPDASRSFILADGTFRPAPGWRTGFTAERAADDFIFDKYDVPGAFVQRGLYAADDHRLISQGWVERQTARTYVSAAAISIQGLRPTDYDRTFPTIAPLVEARFEPESKVFGGRLRLRGGAVALERDQAVSLSAPPPPVEGIDSRRVSAELDWRRTFTFQSGLRASPFLLARSDLYQLDDLPAPGARSATINRAQASLGLDLAYPLIRSEPWGVTILEPIAQLVASPRDTLDPRIPNEDSQVIEFDETNLMSPDKFSGRDLYSGGLRANLGLRATVKLDDGRDLSLLVGRSFQDKREPAYPARTGLVERASDWIVAGETTVTPGLRIFGRARLDQDGGALRRFEAGVDAETSRLSGYVRYLRDENDLTGSQRQDLDINAEFNLNPRWGLTAYAVRDLEGSGWRRQDIGVFYQDECLRLDIIYRRRDEFTNTAAGVRSVQPNQSIGLRLTLATLGDKR